MKQRIQRIALIIFMLAVQGYTVYNYMSGKTDMTDFLVITAFMGFLLFGQIAALIREWKDD